MVRATMNSLTGKQCEANPTRTLLDAVDQFKDLSDSHWNEHPSGRAVVNDTRTAI
jgi:hypothetical protein